jgi:hypothetical protein
LISDFLVLAYEKNNPKAREAETQGMYMRSAFRDSKRYGCTEDALCSWAKLADVSGYHRKKMQEQRSAEESLCRHTCEAWSNTKDT